MLRRIFANWISPDILISVAILAILLTYTYGILFVAPYSGFYFDPSNGKVLSVDVDQSTDPGKTLEVGDMIERIGSMPIKAYLNSRDIGPFDGLQSGQKIEIQVQRDGNGLTIPWIYPGFNKPQFLSRFLNIWWLAYIFWAIGLFTQLFMRPKDTRWRLFVASSYLMGLFIMFGSVSSFKVMGGSTLMRVTAWLLLPVYLHFHWIFPASFRRIPRWLKWIFYVVFWGLPQLNCFGWFRGKFIFLR